MIDIQSAAAVIRRGKKKEERKKEATGQKYNGLSYSIGQPQLRCSMRFGTTQWGNGLRLSTLTRHCRQNMSPLYHHGKTKCNSNTVCQLLCFISPIEILAINSAENQPKMPPAEYQP